MKFSADFIILVFNRADLFPCNLVFFFNSNYDSKIIAEQFLVYAEQFLFRKSTEMLHIPNSNLLSYSFSPFLSSFRESTYPFSTNFFSSSLIKFLLCLKRRRKSIKCVPQAIVIYSSYKYMIGI